MARILIVDDAEQNLLLYELYLKGEEFEVIKARSGREALGLVSRGEFDLILLDVLMPGMDGIEVCRRLKATRRTASIPVIFCTGRMRDESDKMIGYEVGAVDYLTKPVDKRELTARIRVMLRFREERANLARKNTELADAVRKSTKLIASVVEQLENYERLVAAKIDAKEAVIVLDAQSRVLGTNPVAQEFFPALEVGQQIAAVAGGALIDSLSAETRGGGREVELEDGRALRVVAERLASMESTVLRVVDITPEHGIQRRIAERMPDDLPTERDAIATAGRGFYQISKFVGRSPVLRTLTEHVDKLRQSRCTALIVGESGSGKELIASALHFDGPFGPRPFIPIHCGAISPDLIESELFGYEKGAFTGATTRKDGLFAACDGGTIFLDEIAETSLDLQVKLLRVLQQGEVRPVGATRPRHVDVRIIAATNKDLAQMVRDGMFREDLYYRLDVVTVHLPPLRRRKDDIPLLVKHFLAKFNNLYDRTEPCVDVTRGVMRQMQEYDWPGNVRELENVIDRAFALGVGPMLTEQDLPERIRDRSSGLLLGRVALPRSVAEPERFDKRQYERHAMVEALRQLGGNKIEAGRCLGMSRSTFYRKYKEYAIEDGEHVMGA